MHQATKSSIDHGEYITEEARNYCATADRDSRLSLIKELIYTCPHDELSVVVRYADNAKKRRSSNRHYAYKKRNEKRRRLNGPESIPRPVPVDSAQSSVETRPGSDTKSEEVGIRKDDMDVEMVTLNKKDYSGKFVYQAGDWNDNVKNRPKGSLNTSVEKEDFQLPLKNMETESSEEKRLNTCPRTGKDKNAVKKTIVCNKSPPTTPSRQPRSQLTKLTQEQLMYKERAGKSQLFRPKSPESKMDPEVFNSLVQRALARKSQNSDTN